MKRIALLLGVALVLTGMAYAQSQDHKVGATGDYSYFRLNPCLPSYFNSQSLNGGGGQFAFFMIPNIGLAGDLQGYGSCIQYTKPTAPIAGCASGNLFTYMFGPQLKVRMGKLEPFAEVLLGGAHSNFYGNACTKTGICGSKSPSNNAFSFAVGGGVDYTATEKITIRVGDADCVLTRFGNNFTGGNNSQSNFRFQTGIQFRLPKAGLGEEYPLFSGPAKGRGQ